MDIAELFRRASRNDLRNGFIVDQELIVCLLCGKKIEIAMNDAKDLPLENMRVHVKQMHGSDFAYLVYVDKLPRIVRAFEPGRSYNEKQVNEILRDFEEDFVTLRRYLIEFGLMHRKPDGSQYWLSSDI